MPGDHVERRALDVPDPQRAAPFDVYLTWRVAVFVSGDGGQEVARVRHAVGADRAALRQGQGAAVILAEIAARRAAAQLDADLHAARDHGDLAGFDVDDAEFGPDAELALLRHEHQLA